MEKISQYDKGDIWIELQYILDVINARKVKR